MFNTQDNVIRIGMFLMGLMLLMYGGMMTFNLEFFFSRYPTINADQTNSFFITWTGINTLAFLSGVYYMGYKGLQQGFFVFMIPLIIGNIIWIYMAMSASGGENYTGMITQVIALIILFVVRQRAGYKFSYPKADMPWGTDDKVSANLLYLGTLLTVIGIVMYFMDPSAILRDTAGLEVTAQGQHYALGIFVLTPIAILFALVYQWRCGFQGVLLSMSAFWSAMMIAIIFNNLAATSTGTEPNMLLAGFLMVNCIINLTVFFRLQNKF
jgi:hypothetical protein